MIRTIIIDDEENARDLLKEVVLSRFDDLEVIGEADDVKPAVSLIADTEPDLVLLDIQLQNGTGFDVLKALKNRDFGVIFITAYNEYAIKAFQFSALGYILKPLRISELSAAVERFRSLRQKDHAENDNRLKVLVESLENGNQFRKLVLQDQQGFEVVQLDEILFVKAEVNYSEFYLKDKRKIIVSKTLKEYDQLLSDFGFYRIHQSWLINLSCVRRYIRGEGGQVIMEDGAELPVSRRKKQGFLQRFL